MKKFFVLMVMLMLSMMTVCVVSADNEVTAVPSQREETVLTEAAPDDDYFGKWAVDGFGFITDQVTSGWNTMTESIVNGWNSMAQSILDGSDTVGDFFAEQHIDQKVEDAWNTLKEGASNKGEVTKEKLDEAYQTVRNWFVNSEKTVDQEMAVAVDAVASTAGVAEAQVSAAYRTIEIFMTENSEKVTESVKDAWQTICQNAVDMEAAAQEKRTAAYETILEWLKEFETSEAENAEQSLELLENNGL